MDFAADSAARSICRKSTWGGILEISPPDRSSMPTTSYPSCRNALATCEPIKPATPVISILANVDSLVADNADQRVTLSGADKTLLIPLLKLRAEHFCEPAHTARAA